MKILSEETKKKISLSMKGKNTWSKGRKLSAEALKSRIGKYEGSKNPFFGRRHTKETKDKIRLAKTGIKQSRETVEKRRKNLPRGARHHFWKGGVCEENKRIRSSFENKIWRRAVFERDNYSCIWCGARSGKGKSVKLHADHIKPFCDYPELRFAIDNGRTLCVDCHKKTDTYAGKIIRIKK